MIDRRLIINCQLTDWLKRMSITYIFFSFVREVIHVAYSDSSNLSHKLFDINPWNGLINRFKKKILYTMDTHTHTHTRLPVRRANTVSAACLRCMPLPRQVACNINHWRDIWLNHRLLQTLLSEAAPTWAKHLKTPKLEVNWCMGHSHWDGSQLESSG